MNNICEKLSIEGDILHVLDKGDRKAALTLLMNEYGSSVYSYCLRILNDSSIAEDALQVTFIDAYKALDTFRNDSSYKTWLFSIARHRCLDIIKSTKRREQYLVLSDEILEVREDNADPQESLSVSDMRLALQDCLAKYRHEVSSAIMLRYMHGHSYMDMEQICGENAATLQARVARALPTLRRCLENHGVAI